MKKTVTFFIGAAVAALMAGCGTTIYDDFGGLFDEEDKLVDETTYIDNQIDNNLVITYFRNGYNDTSESETFVVVANSKVMLATNKGWGRDLPMLVSASMSDSAIMRITFSNEVELVHSFADNHTVFTPDSNNFFDGRSWTRDSIGEKAFAYTYTITNADLERARNK